MYIRFWGRSDGFFGSVHDFNEKAVAGKIHISDADWRMHLRCMSYLWKLTPEVPRDTYRDWRSDQLRTWFKPEALRQIELAWTMACIMNWCGYYIRTRWSAHPGKIIFEDDVQIVVVPSAVESNAARRSRDRTRWNGDRETIRGAGGFAAETMASAKATIDAVHNACDVWPASTAETSAEAGHRFCRESDGVQKPTGFAPVPSTQSPVPCP